MDGHLLGGAASLFGWTLVHSLWQAGLVAGALALVLRIIPGSAARLRTTAASGALALVAGLAVVVWLGLAADWRQHAECWESHGYASAHPAVCASHGVAPPADAHVDKASKPRAVLAWAWGSPTSGSLARRTAPVTLLATPVTPLLGVAGALLAALALLRLLIDLGVLRGVVRRSRTIADERMTTLLGRVARRMDVRERIELRESAEIGAPGVAGGRLPVILLPPGMSRTLEPDQLECVLAHELTHIRRHHFAINLVQRTLECLLVWNPFASWISRRLREEREALCDIAAAGPPAGRRRYVETLIRLERLRTPTGAALIGLLGEGPLLRRIRRLVEHSAPDRRTVARRAGGAGLAGLAALLFVTQVSVAAMAVSSWAVMEHDMSTREQTPITHVAGNGIVDG
ncbi:MAG: M56 family metallopeptidase [Gemmatimonadota bacterium]